MSSELFWTWIREYAVIICIFNLGTAVENYDVRHWREGGRPMPRMAAVAFLALLALCLALGREAPP